MIEYLVLIKLTQSLNHINNRKPKIIIINKIIISVLIILKYNTQINKQYIMLQNHYQIYN